MVVVGVTTAATRWKLPWAELISVALVHQRETLGFFSARRIAVYSPV